MGKETFQLFSSLPSAIEGAARVLDIGGHLGGHGYVVSASPSEADARALRSDWDAVMHDLEDAATRVESR